ncbi:uncharacterized protein G2W53_016991 [Senna tora]|uniref:Uncharacterized protein n=1 Tax=Senna tora TaxID=362788 RepID=A0A834TQ28_9FABA|nr:uncharacterized protein G2W53_016991 [Senna tora]
MGRRKSGHWVVPEGRRENRSRGEEESAGEEAN